MPLFLRIKSINLLIAITIKSKKSRQDCHNIINIIY